MRRIGQKTYRSIKAKKIRECLNKKYSRRNREREAGGNSEKNKRKRGFKKSHKRERNK